jgi:SMODS-associating 2TM, beta-strand rich effector domain
MWHLLPWRKQVLVVTALAIVMAWAIDAVAEWLQGERAPLLKFISLIATVIAVGVASVASATWRRIWRKFPVVARKIFPDLTGTWEGNLLSTWIDPSTGATHPPIPTTLWIRQSLFSVSIKLRTGESTSYSTRYVLEPLPDAGRFRVWYSYDNQPRAEVAHKSARHEGVAWLEMDIDADPNRLTGQYYSDRRTTGDMTFCRVNNEVTREMPRCSEPVD